MARNSNGQFKRSHQIWDGSEWDDGYFDNRGRFRVYRSDYPRAFKDGYALRSHIVWWITTGQVVEKGMNIHHKDDNRTEDRFYNLQLLAHRAHTIKHHRNPPVVKVCGYCEKRFFRPAWKARTQRCCSHSCHSSLRWKESQCNAPVSEMSRNMTH